MIENDRIREDESVAIVEDSTPAEQILAPLQISDYSQFLYEASYSGVKSTDFTYEAGKKLGLNNGISTSNVRVKFLNDSKTDALFYCTATDRNSETSDVVVREKETENGRVNPNWIEKGCSRAIRNSIKARLPVQLFRTALQRAIAAGEIKQSAIIETQRKLSVTWCERDESLDNIDKRTFFNATQQEYGKSESWDADMWLQIIDDLKNLVDWLKAVSRSPF